ncbi:MAG TPA: M23 family metallopeptidase [Patescibacteria group bacterium]
MHSITPARVLAAANYLLVSLTIASLIGMVSPTLLAAYIEKNLIPQPAQSFEAPVTASVSGVSTTTREDSADFFQYREGTAVPLTTSSSSNVARNTARNTIIAKAQAADTHISASGYMLPIKYRGISRGIITGVHTGIDFLAEVGTPVWAAADGTVTTADASGWNGGWGKTIVITHSESQNTRYAHLSKLIVSEGQVVKRGDVIGYSGNTGRSTGPHLHFELRINGKPRNPF